MINIDRESDNSYEEKMINIGCWEDLVEAGGSSHGLVADSVVGGDGGRSRGERFFFFLLLFLALVFLLLFSVVTGDGGLEVVLGLDGWWCGFEGGRDRFHAFWFLPLSVGLNPPYNRLDEIFCVVVQSKATHESGSLMHIPRANIALTSSDVYCHTQTPFYLRGEEVGRNGARFADLGELEQSAGNGFHHDEAVNLSRSSIYNDLKASNVSVVSSNNLQFGGLNNGLGSAEMVSSGTGVDSGQFISQKGPMVGVGALGHGHFDNWADSGVVADHSQQTDTSTDTDDKNQYHGVHHERLMVVDSMDQCKGKIGDQKAYVQQLENSRLKLTQLEQDLKRARQQHYVTIPLTKPQGVFVSSGVSGDQNQCVGGNGALAFDIDYARWLEEHHRLINDLRSAVNSHVGDSELRLLVEGVMSHYEFNYSVSRALAQNRTYFTCFPACGKLPPNGILGNQIEPLTEQQLVGICNLQQSSQQAEDALSQGMEALQQSLVETLSSNSLGPRNSGNVADYMGQMAIAMSKLATLENFLHQADLLRQQTLQQLQRILTTRQAARALLAISDYRSRLRALSSLWLARPKE
ncbi:hypothetical protein DH2020_034207 [Rehmannia glutinosa]|uniref:DOG1 domain-containing protein n=1 Tax=Rehmannia glutinosa TaxID=99300 RepID=A0ABR0VAL8_REHGL